MMGGSWPTFSYKGKPGLSDHPIGQQLEDETTFVFGPNLGLLSAYYFHPNIGVQLGVLYALKGYKRIREPNDFLGYRSYETYYKSHYIDLPVKSVFRIPIGRHMHLRASIGLVTNVFVQGTERSIRKSDRSELVTDTTEELDYTRVNVSPVIAFGLDIPFRKGFGIRFEPAFQHQALINNTEDLEVRYWSFGFGLTIYYGRGNTWE